MMKQSKNINIFTLAMLLTLGTGLGGRRLLRWVLPPRFEAPRGDWSDVGVSGAFTSSFTCYGK